MSLYVGHLWTRYHHCNVALLSVFFKTFGQVHICWCPRWLEEASYGSCKVYLCFERLIMCTAPPGILVNQNIARPVYSRSNLGDSAKNHSSKQGFVFLRDPSSNPSQSVDYHYSGRASQHLRAGLNQTPSLKSRRGTKSVGKPLTVNANPPETGLIHLPAGTTL